MSGVTNLQPFKAFLLATAMVLLAAGSPAQTGDYLLDVWTSDDDLPDTSVSSIAQTPDGYLWIGTANGLARFDGVRFVVFDPLNTPQLPAARVTGLFVDAGGTLWINTSEGSLTSLRQGVFRHEWQGGEVYTAVSSSNQVMFILAGNQNRIVCRTGRGEWREIPLAGDAIDRSITPAGDGAIWYLVKNKLYRLQGTNSVQVTRDSGLRGSMVTGLTTDGAGNLWAGTDEGIARWNAGRFEDMTPTNGEPGVSVAALYGAGSNCWVFAGGKLRICSGRRWLAEVDARAWPDLVKLQSPDCRAYPGREGRLWLTHQSLGVFRVDPGGQVELFSTDNGLPSNLADGWCQDGEGNIWLGLERGGLVRLRKRQFEVIGPGAGLEAPAVSSVCEDGRSNIWIGTFSGGLYRWQAGKLERFALPDGAHRECFFSVCPDAKNRLWLSAGRENLFLLEDGKIIPSPAPVRKIKTILVDRQGRVWLGRLDGLSLLEHGVLKNFPTTNGLNHVRSLAEDGQGGIWIGTGQGNLFHYTRGEFARFQPDDALKNQPVWSLLAEADGTLWVGTFRGGLLRFKAGKFTRYTTDDGLPGNIICQILDDGLGKLWFGSHKGIYYVPKNAFREHDAGRVRSLPCASYGLLDGLPTLECSGNYQPAGWRGRDGRLWFATAQGVVSVLPENLPDNPFPPRVLIEEIAVDGRPQAIFPGGPPVVISPGKHQFDWRYTALSFAAPDRAGFRYKLEGHDSDWIEGGAKRVAHYGSLPPGKYKFRVIACNSEGVWNGQGAAVDLVVRPQVWQTAWFKGLVMAVFVAALVAGVRYAATRRLRRKMEQLRQQQMLEQDRARIARDIHDELGAGLTRILLQSSLARREPPAQTPAHLDLISQTANDLVGAMDEIVWAINSDNDSLDELVVYAGKFVQEFAGHAGLRCRLRLPTQVPPVYLPSEARHHLFLAVKEALNNIAKHARATEVIFSLELRPDEFSFCLKDNGCGFVPGAAPQSTAEHRRSAPGNGLRNLARRLEKIGGRCVITSQPGQGTVVELAVAIQKNSKPALRDGKNALS